MQLIIFILLSIFLSVSVHAEAIFDGTMNSETTGQTLSGTFEVKESHGRLVGDNLFHSFSHFSINNGESATFSGSSHIQNIISRVTGNDKTVIDGLLRSTINSADFYFINPKGIIFGSNARLKVGGSFYGLTCEYISMDDGQSFDIYTESPTLSVASPQAFGFLDQSAGSIEIKGGDKNLELSVGLNQRISLIGSGIDIQKSFVEAPEGQIYIASISGSCEIIPSTSGFENMDTINRGSISITNNSELNVSGDGSGDIFIMGGHVLFSNSFIDARTEGKQNGGMTLIDASSIIFENHAHIYSDNISYPDNPNLLTPYSGGDVFLHSTGEVLFTNFSKIETGATSATEKYRDLFCHAGSVEIDAYSISFFKKSSISSRSENAGKTGNINLLAQKDILFFDSRLLSEIKAKTHDTTNSIPGSTIRINAENISFVDRGGIASQTINYGYGGDIFLYAKKNIHMDSGSITSFCQSLPSQENSEKIIQGKAGEIDIDADSLLMTHNSNIVTSTKDQRQGGNVEIALINTMRLEQSHISSESKAFDGGAAGKINVNAGNAIQLLRNSALTTEAFNADESESVGKGTIITNAKNTIYLLDSKITSSVLGGKDNAGSIDAFADNVLMNRSQIIAKADKGRGGNIHIVAQQFLQSATSIVDASSNKGIDGQVTIDSPEANASSGLATMPTDLLNAQQWMRTPCDARTTEEISRLVVHGLDASPTSIDDLWPSPPVYLGKLDSLMPDCVHSKDNSSEVYVHQLFSQGYQHYQKGQFDKAANAFRKILNLPQKNLCETIHFSALTCLNRTLCALGYHKEVLSAYENSLPGVESSEDLYLNALFYSNLGDLYLSLRDLPKARQSLKKAYKKAKLGKHPLVIASTLNNFANLRLVENRFQGAIKRYLKGLSLIENFSDEILLKSTLSYNLILAYVKANKQHEWSNAVNTCLSYIQKLPETHDKAALLIALSLRIRDIQSKLETTRQDLTQTALQLLEQALLLAEDLNDQRLLSLANGYMGQIFEHEKILSKAFHYTRQARFIAQQSHLPEILYLWEWQLGRLFINAEQKKAAFLSFKNAMNTLDPIRQQLLVGIRGHEHVFTQKVRPIYLGIASLLLEKADLEPTESTRKNYLNDAINTMEILKKAEIQDYFDDECLTSFQETATGLDRLPPNTGVLYPVPFPDHLSILLTLPDGMKHVKIPVNDKQLRKTVNTFRRLLEDWDGVEEWKDEWFGRLHEGLESAEIMVYSRKLYEWIIRPIEDDLEASNINTLLVAPDGALRLIPLSALNDGDFFLIEKYAIVTIPAISLTDMRPMSQDRGNVLLAGLSEERHGYMPLTGVQKELDGVNSVLSGEILMNEDFSVSNLTQKFKTNKYPIVHLATHGVFGGTPDSTFLLTYDSKLTMNQLEELIRLTQINQKSIDFLALSACQTAQGNERAAFGLAGIALKAGAKSAIATLWTVDDRAASRVLIHFYEQFSFQQSKAKAIQSAMKQLIVDTHFCHPSYWAPFLLIGNWR
ncbi:secreted protein containing Filamentous hemagglutinin [Candidatus Magnetomorum sp. HK-1]|nr:secreted protein containing Filamentous hemagglutinin [Candidatus Magnetomorum sp. HK-1]